MKKYIVIEEEVLVRLVSGKYVEGSLHPPWGWLKASIERVKRYSSVPKDLSLEEKLAIFDEENELIKQALIENYIIESV